MITPSVSDPCVASSINCDCLGAGTYCLALSLLYVKRAGSLCFDNWSRDFAGVPYRGFYGKRNSLELDGCPGVNKIVVSGYT